MNQYADSDLNMKDIYQRVSDNFFGLAAMTDSEERKSFYYSKGLLFADLKNANQQKGGRKNDHMQ